MLSGIKCPNKIGIFHTYADVDQRNAAQKYPQPVDRWGLLITHVNVTDSKTGRP